MATNLVVYPEAGAKPVTLRPTDHVATGGEGAVYRKDDLVYKIYLDPAKAIRAKLDKKVDILKKMAHPGIAAPVDVLRDKSGQFLGIATPFAEGTPFPRVFASGWQQANSFDAKAVKDLASRTRDIVAYAHGRQALMVDANETNWVTRGTHPTVFDVDSWQLPGFPATAIMPSIRDYSASQLSEGTDWFAWAVVSFQLWTGIHPFKGTHPDFARGNLEGRMRAMASLFDKRVRVPAAARDVQAIPAALRDWYAQMFSSAIRSAPPATFEVATSSRAVPKVRVLQVGQGALRMDRLGIVGDSVIAAFDGFLIVRQGATKILWDALSKAAVKGAGPEVLAAVAQRKALVVRHPAGRMLVALREGCIQLQGLDDPTQQAELAFEAKALWSANRRIFALAEGRSDGLVELDVVSLGSAVRLAPSTSWPVSILSTKFFRGGFVQDRLGTAVIGVVGRDTSVLQGTAPALRGYRITDGFLLDADNVWLAAVRRRDGQQVALRLAYENTKFDIAEEQLADSAVLEAAATLTGVGVIRQGDSLRVLKGKTVKEISQSHLPPDLQLFSMEQGIGGFLDAEVVKLSFSG